MSTRYKFAVGIPSYNEAEQIGFVLAQVDKGLSQKFNPLECVIINLDSNSLDGTKEAFLGLKTVCAKRYVTTPRGKGRAMLYFFKYCLDNDIPFMATVDADLKSITPEWIYKLLKPITEGYDYVIPVYTRNRFEANITNHFAYPLILANYGIELRQPLGGEFGYSSRFCRYLLQHPKHLKTHEYGIDIFISCCALFGGFNIKETYLGKKIHAPSFYHMESTFRQVSESGIFITKLHHSKNFKLGVIEKSKKSSGVDEFKYFPHKKIIPKLQLQLARRFLVYKRRGWYEKFVKGKSLVNKIGTIIESGDLSSMDTNVWTEYLASILKVCYRNNFNLSDLKIVSKTTIPVYRWRVMTYWLSVENAKPKEAEKNIRDQAALLKNKIQ